MAKTLGICEVFGDLSRGGQRNPNDGTVLGSASMPLEELRKAPGEHTSIKDLWCLGGGFKDFLFFTPI